MKKLLIAAVVGGAWLSSSGERMTEPAPVSSLTNLIDEIAFNKEGMRLIVKNPHICIGYTGTNSIPVFIVPSEEESRVAEFIVPFSTELGVFVTTGRGEEGARFETLPSPSEKKGFLVYYSHSRLRKPTKTFRRVICPDPSDPSGKKIIFVKEEELKGFLLKQGFDADKVLVEREVQRRQEKARIAGIRKKAIYAIDRQYPVVFPPGEWGDELKTFIIQDLNRIFGAEEVTYRKAVLRGQITQRPITYRTFSRLYTRDYVVGQVLSTPDAEEMDKFFPEFVGMRNFGVDAKLMVRVVHMDFDDHGIKKLSLTEDGMRIYEEAIQENGEIYEELLKEFEDGGCRLLKYYSSYDALDEGDSYRQFNYPKNLSNFIQPSILSVLEKDGRTLACLPRLSWSKHAHGLVPFRLIYKDGNWELFHIIPEG